MRKRPPVLVVAPGAETSWAGDAEVTTQATVVAVDGEGRLAGFGSEAALAAAARGDALRLFQPFSATEIFSVDLTRAYLRWVIESWPAGGRHPVLAFLLPDCAADGVDRWKAVCDSLGVGFITISRPVAAAAGREMVMKPTPSESQTAFQRSTPSAAQSGSRKANTGWRPPAGQLSMTQRR